VLVFFVVTTFVAIKKFRPLSGGFA